LTKSGIQSRHTTRQLAQHRYRPSGSPAQLIHERHHHPHHAVPSRHIYRRKSLLFLFHLLTIFRSLRSHFSHLLPWRPLKFLPNQTTLHQAVFGSGILNDKEFHGISDIFWPFIYTVVPLTLITSALWFWRRQLEMSYRNGRQKLRGRQKRTTGLGDDDVEIGIGIVERKS
jgi:hypothetical protein